MKKPQIRKAGPRYHVRSAVAHRELQGQVLILSADDPALWTMNESGRFIWRRVLRRASTAQIVEAFRREFGVPRETAARDVGAFLESLARRRIIART